MGENERKMKEEMEKLKEAMVKREEEDDDVGEMETRLKQLQVSLETKNAEIISLQTSVSHLESRRVSTQQKLDDILQDRESIDNLVDDITEKHEKELQRVVEGLNKKHEEEKERIILSTRKSEEETKEFILKKDEEMEVDDIFSISDVTDMGNGVALFQNFEQGDWALLQLRFELWLLQVAFKKDVNDEDRPAIQEKHLEHYYGKYFKKQLNQRWYGVETWAELTKMLKDTIAWNDDGLTTPLEGEDISFDTFLKHAEENRRERQRRIVAGDETARLKIKAMAFNPPADKGRGKGGFKKGSTGGSFGGKGKATGKRW